MRECSINKEKKGKKMSRKDFQALADAIKTCKCKNCIHVQKQKQTALSATRPAGKGINDDIVFMWNETLRLFPCLNKK